MGDVEASDLDLEERLCIFTGKLEAFVVYSTDAFIHKNTSDYRQ